MYRFCYMNNVSNFGLAGALGSSAGGGLLYGGGYTLAKRLSNPKDMSPEEAKREIIANGVGGAVSGLGLYAASKLGKLRK